MKCVVRNCKKNSERTAEPHEVSYHVFPADLALREAWIEALGLSEWEPKAHHTVCSNHFQSEDIYKTSRGLIMLKKNAVPVVDPVSMLDLGAPAALKACRVCLAVGQRTFRIAERALDRSLELIGIRVPSAEEDLLPQVVCWECAQRLVNCSSFIEKALRSQSLLLNALEDTTELTVGDITKIDRAHNGLLSKLITKMQDPDSYDLLITDSEVVGPDQSAGPDAWVSHATPVISKVVSCKDTPDLQVQVKVEDSEMEFTEYEVLEQSENLEYDEFEHLQPWPVEPVKTEGDLESEDEKAMSNGVRSLKIRQAELQLREAEAYKYAKYRCAVCERSFAVKYNYEKHMATHSEMKLEGPLCALCDIQFATRVEYFDHLKTSSNHGTVGSQLRNEAEYRVLPCKRRAGWAATRAAGRAATLAASSPRERLPRRVRVDRRQPVDCEQGRTSPALPSVRIRVDERNPVDCEQCHLILDDLSKYREHFRREHPGVRRQKYPLQTAKPGTFICDQCAKRFSSKLQLAAHMWVHTGQKLYSCDICRKRFTQRATLEHHVLRHAGTAPTYACPECGKEFTMSCNRDRHMRIHTGLRPHQCPKCDKRFRTAYETRLHVEHVHYKKPWPKRVRNRKRKAKEDTPTSKEVTSEYKDDEYKEEIKDEPDEFLQPRCIVLRVER